jgi:K+-sensing histidine kinase KdpD
MDKYGIPKYTCVLLYMADEQRSHKKSSLTQQSAAALYDLRSTIAHELRTPLTSIVGFAEALLADATVEEETRKKIATILRTEGERLNRTVDELLHASALQLARANDSLSESDLASVLAMVARFASQRFPSKTFCVSYALAPGTTLPAMNSGDLFSATFYLVSVIARLTYDHLPITLGLESSSQRPIVTVTCQFNARVFENGSAGAIPGLESKPATGPLREEEITRTIAHRVVEYYGGTVHTDLLDDGETVFKIEFPA